jgi:hypothetical protein
MRKLISLTVVAALVVGWFVGAGCGVAYRHTPEGGTEFIGTFWKDIAADGEVVKPDGTRYKGKVSSAVNAEQLGTVIGTAVKAAK